MATKARNKIAGTKPQFKGFSSAITIDINSQTKTKGMELIAIVVILHNSHINS
jgi:hypothetical protein